MRILVAADLKSNPHALIDAAKEWGERLSSPIDVVYVDETGGPMPKVKDPAVQSVIAASWHKQRADYVAAVQAVLDRLPPEIRGNVVIETGPVIPAILRAAESYGLVILGNDSHGGFTSFFGSASESLVRAFRKPVLLLRVTPE